VGPFRRRGNGEVNPPLKNKITSELATPCKYCVKEFQQFNDHPTINDKKGEQVPRKENIGGKKLVSGFKKCRLRGGRGKKITPGREGSLQNGKEEVPRTIYADLWTKEPVKRGKL